MAKSSRITIKLPTELADKLNEDYKAQCTEEGGIEFKGDYFGQQFIEAITPKPQKQTAADAPSSDPKPKKKGFCFSCLFKGVLIVAVVVGIAFVYKKYKFLFV